MERKTLLKGVEKHGEGKWTAMKMDPELRGGFSARTTIDIATKYRQLRSKSRKDLQKKLGNIRLSYFLVLIRLKDHHYDILSQMAD